MTKKKAKKPTIKELFQVQNNLIMMVEHLRVRVSDLEFIIQTYHEWKNEKPEFIKHLHEKVEKLRKDRDSSSVHNNGQQKVSKSAQSTNS